MAVKHTSMIGVICLALGAFGCASDPVDREQAAIFGEHECTRDCDAGIPDIPDDDVGEPMDAGTPPPPPPPPDGDDAGTPDDGDDAGMPDDACTYTQGFYENRPSDWPVTELTIAGELYTQSELLDIYAMSTSGDMSIALAHQVITAMLNVEAGATAPAALGDALAFLAANADADGRLPFGFSAGSLVHIQASFYNDALAAFNEGRAGTPHCDDLPGMDGDLDPDVDEAIDEAMLGAMARD